MNQDAFKAAISEMDPLVFCRRHLFDASSWVFDSASGIQSFGSYEDFKFNVASAINTSPNNVAIVGSGKYGFSMAPNKALRAFNPDKSDIDVVIVSSEVFNQVWSEFRAAIYAGYSHLSKHANEVMLRFIVLGSADRYNTTYLRETAKTVAQLAADLNRLTRIPNEFKFRIYSSWSDVELYHSQGVTQLTKAVTDVN